MDKLICKSGNNNLIEKEDTSELEKKVGSILLTLIQKAVVLAAKYSKSSGRDNLSSMDMIYALQYYAHEFNNEEDLEESFVENEIEYEKMIKDDAENDVDPEDAENDVDPEDPEDEGSENEDDSEDAEEDDPDEEFCRSESNDAVFIKMNEYHDTWDTWDPTELSEKVMKSAIDKVINEIDMLEIIET